MILTSIKYIIYVHYYKIYDNLDVIIEHWWQDWYSLSLSLSLLLQSIKIINYNT